MATGLLLNITPGADTLYILGRAAAHGLRGGLLAALGIGAGCLVHIVAAALGVSALLAASGTAFNAVKLLGAAYLVYLGVALLLKTSRAKPAITGSVQATGARIFWQGFLTNALNPKVALFFLALLPQFVAADAGNKPLAMLFLGLVFDINGTLWNILVALAAARVAKTSGYSRVLALWLNRAVGGVFIYLGIRLASSHA